MNSESRNKRGILELVGGGRLTWGPETKRPELASTLVCGQGKDIATPTICPQHAMSSFASLDLGLNQGVFLFLFSTSAQGAPVGNRYLKTVSVN